MFINTSHFSTYLIEDQKQFEGWHWSTDHIPRSTAVCNVRYPREQQGFQDTDGLPECSKFSLISINYNVIHICKLRDSLVILSSKNSLRVTCYNLYIGGSTNKADTANHMKMEEQTFLQILVSAPCQLYYKVKTITIYSYIIGSWLKIPSY